MAKNEEFFSIKECATYQIVIKKSKFIANVFYVESEEEAENKIKQIKKKYYDAKHNCFAFSIIQENKNEYKKCSDDGEPSGTAGLPILNIIEKGKLSNIVVIVTRYFGGILLGTGGLTRAYSDATIGALENAKIVKIEAGKELSVEINYNQNKNFMLFCKKNDINILEEKYQENIIYKIGINERQYSNLKNEIQENNVDWKIQPIQKNENGRIFIKKEI